jgi:multidrug efflux pump subunit AcrB
MNLPRLALEKRAITYFFTFLLAIGGIVSFFELGWLEDPEFTVKTAAIITTYPGASAEEVELEVTDRIELKLQEMQEIKKIYSESRPGLSIIKVDIKDDVWSDVLPQTWDVIRKKIGDIEHTLPPGASTPSINDDFGYVFGFLMAVTGDGFTYSQLQEYVDILRKELSLVKGVARIDLWGVQDKRIYLDVSQTQMAALGITREDILKTLQRQNVVVNAGYLDVLSERVRISPTGAFITPEDIGELTVTSSFNPKEQGELIKLRDIMTVQRGYAKPALNLMRINGEPSIGLAMAPVSGANVVEVGEAIDARIHELMNQLPVGIEIERIAWQGDQVEASIIAFMINLVEAVAIVLLVLAVSMGLRIGIIIGVSGLVMAILATFIVMEIMEIDLHRVSLGALIIAMGMMVDNAIVVADGFVVKLKRGMNRRQAAIEAANQPSWPLLGATVVACMAFYPIYASTASTGEFAGSLFVVVGISLLMSWLMSQTLTPLMCEALIPDPKSGDTGDVYGSKFYQVFRALLSKAIKARVLFMLCMVALLVASILGFGQVKQVFFPESSRLQVMVDYWEQEGTRIEEVSANIVALEEHLLADPRVESVSSFIGGGPPRFYLPVSPESPHSSYAQLIVNTVSLDATTEVVQSITPWVNDEFPNAMVRVRKFPVGSFNDWQFEARFSGPAEADPEVLRSLARQGMAILDASPYAKEVRTNWLNRVKKIEPEYDQVRGRWTGVSRDDLARASRASFDGVAVGLFREGDDLIPIIARNTEAERLTAASNFDQLPILSSFSTETVPLIQVTKSINVSYEDPVIWRWNRRRAITVQASPEGVTFPAMRAAVVAEFDAIELPHGYTLEWGGEYDSAKESQDGLKPGIIPALVIMILIIIVLFNAYRPTFVIFLTIPFAFIGITAGLLLTNTAFGFMAVLGAMSLAGMMIKNSIVLLDQVRLNNEEGMSPYDAVVEAAVSRLNPVINAAATTVLGLAPLLQDVFWISMAVTIMFGLTFGTILTMVVVPVLYALLYKVKED